MSLHKLTQLESNLELSHHHNLHMKDEDENDYAIRKIMPLSSSKIVQPSLPESGGYIYMSCRPKLSSIANFKY